jgi:hypothetical protein
VSESVEDIRCSDLVVLGSVEGMMDLSFYLWAAGMQHSQW